VAVNVAACPKGARTGTLLSPKAGLHSRAIQHLTSVQIYQSGSLWLSNNWSTLAPPTRGVVELIGMATPVCTPLLALPRRPSSSRPCPGS
jgi:hypothetical protein